MTEPTPGAAPALRERLSAELKAAMKRRDTSAVAVLRTALGALANAEAVDQDTTGVARAGAVEGAAVGVGAADAPRRELSAEQQVSLVRGEIAALDAAAAEYHCFGSHDEAERLLAQAAILREILRDAAPQSPPRS